MAAKAKEKGLTRQEEFGTDGFMGYYGYAVEVCRMICTGAGEGYFITTIIIAIVLAGVLVGIDTYDDLREMPIFATLESVVLFVFVLECVLKIIAEGKKPVMFFCGEEGSWNTFDFIVVLFCMPFFSDIFGNNSPAIRIVSRLFRLFRVAKIVHKVPALQVIVKGLIGGLKSIVYVATLLLLVFYLYAIFGVFIFKENDPFFFGNVPTALLSLFRACTLENWGDNMYINMFGCREYDGGIYQSRDDMNQVDWDRLPDMYKCINPQPQAGLAGAFFVSFTVISSLVMLSLFIGVITMSMQESLNDMRREVEESNRMKRLIKAAEDMAAAAAKTAELEGLKEFKRSVASKKRRETMMQMKKDQSENPDVEVIPDLKAMLEGDADEDVTPTMMIEEDSESDEEDEEGDMFSCLTLRRAWKPYKKALHRTFMGFYPYRYFYEKFLKTEKGKSKRLSASERKAMADMREMKMLMMQAWHGTKASSEYHHDLDVSQDGTLDKYIRHAGIQARWLCENNYFTNFITGVILATAVIVGVETDHRTEANGVIFDVLENVIFGVFLAEVVIRFFSDDCVPREYFASSWNTFDFLVVSFSKIPGGGAIVVMLRLVRLLRVLKLVKSMPQLAVIVNALLMGLSSIGYIGIIMFLTFYLFAILGIILFKDNDIFNFGTLHQAMVALFKVATLDNWGDILYLNIYGCDVYPPFFNEPTRMITCETPYPQPALATVFFALFVVVGSLVMITLFVGVVTTSMEEATRMQTVELEIETRILDLCHERSVTNPQLDIYRRVFSMLDLDGGGTIESEELRSGLQAVNIECNDEQLDVWVKEVDENSDGVIDLIEFIIFMTNMKSKALKEQEEKLMRKGADGFLKMRARAQARRAAEAKNGGGNSASITPTESPGKEGGDSLLGGPVIAKPSPKVVKLDSVEKKSSSGSFGMGLTRGLSRMSTAVFGETESTKYEVKGFVAHDGSDDEDGEIEASPAPRSPMRG